MSLAEMAAKIEAKQEEIQKMMKEDGEREIKAAIKELFAAYKDLRSIRWAQYTPHFNDGDACEAGNRPLL